MNYRLTVKFNNRSHFNGPLYFKTEEEMAAVMLSYNEDDYILIPECAEWSSIQYNVVPPSEKKIAFFY